MFAKNIKNTDFAAHTFARYRDTNSFLITHLNNILKKIEKLQGLENHEKKDVLGISFFNSAGDLEKIFDALDLNSDSVEKLIKQLIQHLEKEKEELSKHFGKLEHNQIENINHLEAILIKYNQEQYDMIQQLNTYVPNIIELSENVMGVELRTMKDAAASYTRIFEKLENSLIQQANKGHLYFITVHILRALGEYRNKYEHDFETSISHTNAKKFAHNFFHLESQAAKDVKKLLQDAKFNDEDSYNNLKDDDEKFAKRVSNILNTLLGNIELDTGEDKKTTKDLISKIIQLKSNFKDLEKEFKSKYDAIIEKTSKESFVHKKKPEDLLFIIDGLTEYISFKDFKKDKLKEKEKDMVERVNHYLSLLIPCDKKKEPYKSFKEFNISQGIFAGTNTSSGGGSSDSEDLSDEDKKKINKEFTNNAKEIHNILAALHTAVNERDDSKIKNIIKQNVSNLQKALEYFSFENIDKDEKVTYLLNIAKEVFNKTSPAKNNAENFIRNVEYLLDLIKDNNLTDNDNYIKDYINYIDIIYNYLYTNLGINFS